MFILSQKYQKACIQTPILVRYYARYCVRYYMYYYVIILYSCGSKDKYKSYIYFVKIVLPSLIILRRNQRAYVSWPSIQWLRPWLVVWIGSSIWISVFFSAFFLYPNYLLTYVLLTYVLLTYVLLTHARTYVRSKIGLKYSYGGWLTQLIRRLPSVAIRVDFIYIYNRELEYLFGYSLE